MGPGTKEGVYWTTDEESGYGKGVCPHCVLTNLDSGVSVLKKGI